MVVMIIEMIMIMIKMINGGDNKYVQYYGQCSSDSFLLVKDMKFCHLLIRIYMHRSEAVIQRCSVKDLFLKIS